jgi:hypothetical protein
VTPEDRLSQWTTPGRIHGSDKPEPTQPSRAALATEKGKAELFQHQNEADP